MDVVESVGGVVTGVEVGDLVFPCDDEEFLFAYPAGMDPDFDPVEVIWESVPGLVIEVLPNWNVDTSYRRVRVMVGGCIGWTYSDFVHVVGRRDFLDSGRGMRGIVIPHEDTVR
jgi:hypothetical protein